MSNARVLSKQGNAPIFSATKSATQSIPATTITKVTFDTKQFDTANAFDNVTNHRFNPKIAGYYKIDVNLYNSGTITGQAIISKNGAVLIYGPYNAGTGQAVTGLFYLNGSTDYLEASVFYATSGTLSTSCFFQGFLAQAS